MEAQDTHPNSQKVYVGPMRAPMREIALSGGEPPLRVYDSSGPQGHDVREGLPPLRRDWILGRGDVISVPRTYIPDSRRRAELPRTLFRSVRRISPSLMKGRIEKTPFNQPLTPGAPGG